MTDQTQQPDMKRIETLDDFAYLIRSWHHNNMSQLLHLLDIPVGTPMTIQLEADGEAEEIVLDGDLLKGFKAALVVSMNIFNQLPFGGVELPEDGAASGN